MSSMDLDVMSLSELDMNATLESLEGFLESIRNRCGLSGMVYFCSSFHGCDLMNPFIVRTRGTEWAEAYKTKGRAKDDPLVQIAARSLLPIDWAQARRRRGRSDFGGDLGQRAVGAGERQGLTIPVRGPTNSIWAFLHATSDEDDAEWQARRVERIKDLVHIAHYLHQRAYEMHREEVPADLNAITRREIEAIECVSEGKSVEATAAAMRISVETAKAHLDSARIKLQALNRIHAVTKALRAGLIH